MSHETDSNFNTTIEPVNANFGLLDGLPFEVLLL